MISVLRAAAQSLLRPRYMNFIEQLESPHRAQQALLKILIRNLANTEYGRTFGVNEKDGFEEFARKIPVVSYDEIREWIERQMSREGNVIVSEPVLFYEKTSGSSGPAKYIPYTKALKTSFNNMFSVWLYDLLTHGPRFDTGKTFISISPDFGHTEATEQGVRIGLDDDSDYLMSSRRWLLKRFFVVPGSIKQLRDEGDFKHALSALLLTEPDLEVISVWNPSFVEVILDWIQSHRAELIETLKSGVFARGGVGIRLKRISPDRLALLAQPPIEWRLVWPKLKLISCWTSSNAGPAARRVGELFPHARIQGKGLLATEAPLTIPWIEASGYVPLPGEVFYEFLDDRGNISLLHELEPHRQYEIILSQKTGLYRYRLGDRVRVTHFWKGAPCLEFVGRTGDVCDLVGEKLNEAFVRDCLSRVALDSRRFQFMLPVMPERGPSHYVLVIDELERPLLSVEEEIEKALCDAHHYRNARLLGQLAPVRVRVEPRARDKYYEYFVGKGMKLGNIKHQCLVTNIEDAAHLLALVESTADVGALRS